jgi:DNA-cytosine methyltransferase
MIVLSLFDGMSCRAIALKELSIPVKKYYASEVDKHAIKQTQLNFPDTIQLGDVTKVKASDIGHIDLVIGGSPCQGFSFAGKQLNFDDPRSKLFFEFVRILNEAKKINPDVKFLLENVNMKKEYLRVISEYLGVFPVRLNSNLVSAQNRDRWYWTNIRTKKVGLFEELYSDIPEPEDRDILLKDILQDESEVDEKYYLNSNQILRGLEQAKAKVWESGNKMGNMKFPNDSDDKAKTLTTLQTVGGRETNHVKVDKQLKIKPDQDKASCFTAGGNSGDNHSDMDIICEAMRRRNPDNSSDRTKGATMKQRLEPKTDGKTNTLTSVAKDNLILHNTNKNTIFTNKKDEKRKDQKRTRETLLALRNIISKKKDEQWQMAVYARFFENEVLFERMYERIVSQENTASKNNKEWKMSSSKANAKIKVRYMQKQGWNRCSSQRWESTKQFIRQLAKVMQELSQQDTQQERCLQDMWKTTKRAWILRQALSEVQKIWESYDGQTKSTFTYNKSYRLRRLTPIEASRLQTIPEWYRWDSSDTQIYRMLGNGWTVEMIKHIFSYL